METLELFSTGRKSKHSLILNNLDSIRSTLFGKFYEGIIARWLDEIEGFKHVSGKPSVYWNQILNLENSEDEFLSKLYEALNNKKERGGKYANSDGLFIKNGEYYLWEAKNWPKWNGGKKIEDQVKSVLLDSAWLLAKGVRFKKENYKLKGLLFSWWQEFNNYKVLEQEISEKLELSFKFYFTSNILNQCRIEQFPWYINIINEQKCNIDEFFDRLLSKP